MGWQRVLAISVFAGEVAATRAFELMKPRIFTSDRPRVFAHRGGAALAPENTITAFDNGLALGADGLELDGHLSRDGVVMVRSFVAAMRFRFEGAASACPRWPRCWRAFAASPSLLS